MKGLHVVTFILLVVGGLNWGLIGLGDWNVVNMIFGSVPVVERIVYVLVGLAAVYEAFYYGSRTANEPSFATR